MLHHDYQCMKHRSTQVTVMAPMWAAYTPLFSAISLDVLSWTETWRPLHGKRLSRLGMPLPTILGWICCLMVCTFKLFGFGQLFFFKLMSESVGSCYRGCWDLFFLVPQALWLFASNIVVLWVRCIFHNRPSKRCFVALIQQKTLMMSNPMSHDECGSLGS